eukprot:10810437-Lingulodinium_polyedra.AAC.1
MSSTPLAPASPARGGSLTRRCATSPAGARSRPSSFRKHICTHGAGPCDTPPSESQLWQPAG